MSHPALTESLLQPKKRFNPELDLDHVFVKLNRIRVALYNLIIRRVERLNVRSGSIVYPKVALSKLVREGEG